MRIKLLFFSCLTVLLCRGQSPAIQTIQRSLPQITDSLSYVDALNRLAMLLYEKNIDSTFFYTRRAREMADRIHYAQGKADAVNNLGVVYDIKGNSQFAMRYYDEAHTGYEALHDSPNIVQTTMNIAEVYDELGKPEKAVAGYKKALAMGNTLTHDSILSLVIFNYLLKYSTQLSKDSAAIYMDKARRIGLKYHDNRVLLALDQITADEEIKNGHREEGIALLRRTIDKADSSQLYFFSLDVLINVGDQLAGSDSAMAVHYYRQGLATSNQKGYSIYSQQLARRLFDLYTVHQDDAAALNYARQLIKLNDEQEELTAHSSIDYTDYALKDQELEAVRLRSRYQGAFLILAGVICVMTIGIIVILWRSRRKTQRTASVLRLQSEQSEATMASLDTVNKNYARVIKMVAHDLRNPIGAIGPLTAMLAKKEPGPEADQFVHMIQGAAQTSLSLINQLLENDLDQQQNLVKENTDINTLLQQCVDLLSFRARDKGQRLIFIRDGSIELPLDQEKISRVVSNLIGNAIKFSPQNGEIIVAAQRKVNTVVITVRDEGIGIPAQLQENLFDPFTSARRPGTGGEKPFGLGLYISKQIVEGHQGRIGFKSQPGEGTEFFVELSI